MNGDGWRWEWKWKWKCEMLVGLRKKVDEDEWRVESG